MTTRERRRFPRYQFQGTGVLAGATHGGTEQVAVVNLSIDGCRVLGANLPLRGAQCQISLVDHGKDFTAECEITWQGEGVAGIRFVAVDERNMELLRQICKGLSLEPLQPPNVPGEPRPE